MTSYIGERVKMMHGGDIIADGTNDKQFVDAMRRGIDVSCDVRRIGCISSAVSTLTSAVIERQLNFVRGRISNIV